MYPELPNSLADLTTHPPCDGPKLSPFKFHGDVQNIKFLEKIGQGLHSYVFKVEIGNKLYALKLVSKSKSHKPMPMARKSSNSTNSFRFRMITTGMETQRYTKMITKE